MPLPPTDAEPEVEPTIYVPVGTKVDLTLEQFAESFKGFIFAIQFVATFGVETRHCQVTGEVTEKGLEVVVVE